MSDGGHDNRTPSTAPRVVLVIPTHTTRHLAMCLCSLAWQSRAIDAAVVTCDTDDDAIKAEIDRIVPVVWASAASRGVFHGPLVHACRTHQGEARLNQVRNNGLRALERSVGLSDSDLVVVLDGDTLLAPNAIGAYASLAATRAQVVVPFRVNVDQPRTALLDEGELLRAASASQLPAVLAQLGHYYAASLKGRQERYERQIASRNLWNRLGLFSIVKPHKPKILGGHHAVRVGALRAVNAYDEMYVGYGYDDDDLTRRLYGHTPGLPITIAVDSILAFHLWHPSRAPARPTDTPGYERFSRRDLPYVAEHGWATPRPQPPLEIRTVIAGARK